MILSILNLIRNRKAKKRKVFAGLENGGRLNRIRDYKEVESMVVFLEERGGRLVSPFGWVIESERLGGSDGGYE